MKLLGLRQRSAQDLVVWSRRRREANAKLGKLENAIMEVGKTVKKKVKLGNKKLGLDLVGPSDANEGSGVFIAG